MLTTKEASAKLVQAGISCSSVDIAKLASLGAFPGATKEPDGTWRIPADDIITFIGISRKKKRTRRFVVSGGALVVIGLIFTLVSSIKDGTDLFQSYYGPRSGNVTVSRVIPLVNNDVFQGYEVLVSNATQQNEMIVSATFNTDAYREGGCMMSQYILYVYDVEIELSGKITVMEEDSTTYEGDIIGGVYGRNGEQYEISGSYKFEDTCNLIEWSFEIVLPVSVPLPANGFARMQTLFDITGSKLVDHKQEGGSPARSTWGGGEHSSVTIKLSNGKEIVYAIEENMAGLVIGLAEQRIQEKL